MTKINHLHQIEPFQKNWEGGKSALYSHVIFFISLTLNYCTSVQSTEPVFFIPGLPRTCCLRVASALLLQKALVLYSIEEREMSLPFWMILFLFCCRRTSKNELGHCVCFCLTTAQILLQKTNNGSVPLFWCLKQASNSLMCHHPMSIRF